jgi:hypothetical protein
MPDSFFFFASARQPQGYPQGRGKLLKFREGVNRKNVLFSFSLDIMVVSPKKDLPSLQRGLR